MFGKILTQKHPKLRKFLGDIVSHTRIEIADIRKSLQLLEKTERPRNIYIDVTGVYLNDLGTGIQRVVKCITPLISEQLPTTHKVVTVYFDRKSSAFKNCYLNSNSTYGNKGSINDNSDISIEIGDIFVGLDFQVNNVFDNLKYFIDLHKQGMKTFFVLYDLLPIEFPTYFLSHVQSHHELWLKQISRFSGVLCISNDVKNKYLAWLNKNSIKTADDFLIASFVLGEDFLSSATPRSVPLKNQGVLIKIASARSSLMVGTIEPRKGHIQVLTAYEHLWDEGSEDVLVLVGKRGWKCESTIEKIERHRQLGKKLFWFESASDEFLDQVYRASNFFIAASYGEGFGLPVVEASRYGIPVLVRNIPIFTETMGEFANYYVADDSAEFLVVLKDFLEKLEKGAVISSTDRKANTWRKSAQNFIDLIL